MRHDGRMTLRLRPHSLGARGGTNSMRRSPCLFPSDHVNSTALICHSIPIPRSLWKSLTAPLLTSTTVWLHRRSRSRHRESTKGFREHCRSEMKRSLSVLSSSVARLIGHAVSFSSMAMAEMLAQLPQPARCLRRRDVQLSTGGQRVRTPISMPAELKPR